MEFSPQLILRILACVCIALCLASAVFAALLYRRDDIKGVRADLSGKARQVSALEALQQGQSLEQLKRVRSMEEGILKKEATMAASAAPTPVAVEDTSDGEGSVSRSRSVSKTPRVASRVVPTYGKAIVAGSAAVSTAGFAVSKSLVHTEATVLVEIR